MRFRGTSCSFLTSNTTYQGYFSHKILLRECIHVFSINRKLTDKSISKEDNNTELIEQWILTKHIQKGKKEKTNVLDVQIHGVEFKTCSTYFCLEKHMTDPLLSFATTFFIIQDIYTDVRAFPTLTQRSSRYQQRDHFAKSSSFNIFFRLMLHPVKGTCRT